MLPQTIKIRDPSVQLAPSHTYKINWETKRIGGFVEGDEALKQAIDLHLSTERYRWLIYSWQYGSELDTLIGKPMDYVKIEMRRMIKDALIHDKRVRDVTDFDFTINGRNILCKFTAVTLSGPQEMEIDLNA